jgi:hypothetical protein
MQAWRRWVKTIFILAWVTTFAKGQSNPLDIKISIQSSKDAKSQKEYLKYISNKYSVLFSYNANILDDDRLLSITQFDGKLSDFLDLLFKNPPVKYSVVGVNKIVLTPLESEIKPVMNRIVGIVSDSTNGGTLSGALVMERYSGRSVVSNEDGYFIMYLPTGAAHISIQYVGYRGLEKDINISGNTNMIVSMENILIIPEVVVDAKSRLNLNNSGEIIDVFKTNEIYTISGAKDPVNTSRITPGVQSGGEGQTGLYVRGGSPDQNLVILDGVALYETSHTAGIASIFIDETINSASLIKNGFPARYGGRLSSVLDVQLKNGDPLKHHRAIIVGLPGIQAHFHGPLYKEKTTYNVAAKLSWQNLYINQLLTPFTKFDFIDLQYHDIVAKFSHQFDKNKTLNLTMYSGQDKVSLTKYDTLYDDDQALNIYDKNLLSWTNKFASLKYTSILNDKFVMRVQSGFLRYRTTARSSYIFETIGRDSSFVNELDVITSSFIDDLNARVDVDFYFDERHTFKFGINQIFHRMNPTLKQSTVILSGEPSQIFDSDSSRLASEFNMYFEDNFKLHSKIFLYAGLHAAVYNLDRGQGGRFSSIQPRLNAIWAPDKKHIITMAYSKMAQFSHLIANSGLGLPTSIWVPSTTNVDPELATQWSAKYEYNLSKSTYVSLGGYKKNFDNLLEFTSPIELFYFLINNQSITPVFNTSRDWERNIVSGTGKSDGVEWLLHKKEGRTQGWFSVTKSKTTRTFTSLNLGQSFPATYNRTWDVNAGISQKLGKHWTIGTQFVYGSGRYFTLASEEYDSVLGIKLLKATSRNNYQLAPFHQASVNASYQRRGKLFDSRIDFNIYNVYNRHNPYFIYIYRNEEANVDLGRKVSILPITPSINYSIKF